MTKEQEGREDFPQILSGIHINLVERSVTLEVHQQPVVKLTFSPHGVIYFQPPPGAHIVEANIEPSPQPTSSPTTSEEAKEKQQPVTLSGKLKTKPKEGKQDSRGNATAWAKLAVHEEDREDVHMYLATFHRHTARIALGLEKDAQVTLQGYPHPSEDPKRADTFSVINLVNYPGKPKKA